MRIKLSLRHIIIMLERTSIMTVTRASFPALPFFFTLVRETVLLRFDEGILIVLFSFTWHPEVDLAKSK